MSYDDSTRNLDADGARAGNGPCANGKASNHEAIGSISARTLLEPMQQAVAFARPDKSEGSDTRRPANVQPNRAADTPQHDHVALLLTALDTDTPKPNAVAVAVAVAADACPNSNTVVTVRRRKPALKNVKSDSTDGYAHRCATARLPHAVLISRRSYSDREQLALRFADTDQDQDDAGQNRLKSASQANLRSPEDYEDLRMAKLGTPTQKLSLAASNSSLAKAGSGPKRRSSKPVPAPNTNTSNTTATQNNASSTSKTPLDTKRAHSPPAYFGATPHKPTPKFSVPAPLTPVHMVLPAPAAAGSGTSPKVANKFKTLLQTRRSPNDDAAALRRSDNETASPRKSDNDLPAAAAASPSPLAAARSPAPVSPQAGLAAASRNVQLQKMGKSPFAAALGIAKLLRIKKNRKEDKASSSEVNKTANTNTNLLSPANAMMRRVASSSNSNLSELKEEPAAPKNKLLLSPGTLIKSLQQPVRKPLPSTGELPNSGSQSPNNCVCAEDLCFAPPRKSDMEQLANECVRKWKPSAHSVKLWSNSFQALLNDDCGRELFLQFLKSEFSEENIEFWIACENHRHIKQSDDDALQRSAHQIYEQFIAVQAAKEVNLDSTTRSATILGLEHLTVSTFDLAQRRIESLMEKDSYQRFLRCDLYKVACSLAESNSSCTPASPPSGGPTPGQVSALTST